MIGQGGPALITFSLTLILFALVVMRVRKLIRSPSDFFHSSAERPNLASLVAANITIGTGVSYLLLGGSQNGLLMLLVPLGVLVGYFSLEWFATHKVSSAIHASGNFFTGARELIDRARPGQSSYFGWLVLVPLLVCFLLLFAYELFVSSQLIAGLIFSPVSMRHEVVIVTALFSASLFYTSLGGVVSVFRTDFLQLLGILVFLVTLILGAFSLRSPLPIDTWIRADLQISENIT